MRIALLTLAPPDPRAPGAIPVLLHAQLVGLSERHDVTVVTVAGPETHELDAVARLAGEGVDVHAAMRRPLQGRSRWARRARLANAWLEGRWPWRTVWYWQPRLQELLDRLARERSFDVVLAEDNAMGIYRLPADALRVLTEYEVRRPRRIVPPPPAPRAWPGWAFREADWHRWPAYERDVWGRFDVVQVFTERDAAAIREIAPGLGAEVQVNPFAVALPPEQDDRGRPDTIGFLGNYTHPPNVDAAVWLGREILPRLRQLRPEARLVIAGPQAPESVRSLAGADVDVLGVVPDAEEFMRSVAVVVAPIRSGGGMRMKVLHAMALARPVVTTPRGTEGLTTDGRMPPVRVADDADAIAAATARLLADDESRRALGSAARRFAQEHHSPAASARRLEELCSRSLGLRTGRRAP